MAKTVPVEGITELVLQVAELERAERFYVEVLGLPVVERWPHRDAIWVLAGSTRIGLWLPQVGLEGSRGGEHVHFAIRIADSEFDAQVESMRSHGLEAPVHEFPGSEGFKGASRSAYATDPDGHLVEFWTADLRRAYGAD